MTLSFRVEQTMAPNGAMAEVAAMIHQGREFTALGSIVDEENGYLVGYAVERDGRLALETFGGAEICPLRRTKEYRGGFGHTKICCYQATYNGRVYSGRHGDMDLLRMRAGRKVSP